MQRQQQLFNNIYILQKNQQKTIQKLGQILKHFENVSKYKLPLINDQANNGYIKVCDKYMKCMQELLEAINENLYLVEKYEKDLLGYYPQGQVEGNDEVEGEQIEKIFMLKQLNLYVKGKVEKGETKYFEYRTLMKYCSKF